MPVTVERPKIHRSTVKVVSFDLWLTLIKSNPTPNRANRAKALYELLSLSSIPFEAFAKIVKDTDKEADELVKTGACHYGPRERIDMVTHHLGVAPLSDTVFAVFYEEQFERFLEYPPHPLQEDTLETLERLSENYLIACISNTGFVDGAEMRPALQRAGILEFLDIQIFSNEVGVNKPDPRIFETMLELSGCFPEQVLHIGDDFVADYEGARSMGMHAVHLSDPSVPLSILLADLL